MKAPGAGAAPAVELDGSDDVVRTYTWGLDLAGLHTANSGPGRSGYPTSGGFLQAAGGIGGLLAVYDADASDGYVYFHDANGNVGQVVAWENGYGGANGDDWHADRLVAKYEYSPFGAVVGPDDDADGDWRDDAGAFATDNPFRFSTKWHDDAIGVSDFGARMYSATLGRFLNRDPIAEAGGVNLYAFAANNPVNYVDPFGYNLAPGCGFGVTCPEYDAGAELLGGDSGIDLGPGGSGGDGTTTQPTSGPTTKPSLEHERCENIKNDMLKNDLTVKFLLKELLDGGCNTPTIKCVSGGLCDSGDYSAWIEPDGIFICEKSSENTIRKAIRHELGRAAWNCTAHGPDADGNVQLPNVSCAEAIEELLFVEYLDDEPGTPHEDRVRGLCGNITYCDHPFYLHACGSEDSCKREFDKQMKEDWGHDCKFQ